MQKFWFKTTKLCRYVCLQEMPFIQKNVFLQRDVYLQKPSTKTTKDCVNIFVSKEMSISKKVCVYKMSAYNHICLQRHIGGCISVGFS